MQKQYVTALFLTFFLFGMPVQADSLQDFGRNMARNPVGIKPAKITGPLSFLDEKNSLYTLSELDVPEAMSPDTAKELKALTDKKVCTLYQTKNDKIGRVDRMGQSLGHFECGPDLVWIQGALLAKGLARVRTTPENRDLASTMLKIENEARTKKLGLWSRPENALLTADTALQHLNGFQIIEGTVYAVAPTRETIYLNFARDWKSDFTIGIPMKLTRDFSAARINLQSLRGQKIRVRGWVRDYNGPYIEVDHIEQIEILGGGSATSSLAPNKPDSSSEMGMHSIGINSPKAPSVKAPEAPKPESKKEETPTNAIIRGLLNR